MIQIEPVPENLRRMFDKMTVRGTLLQWIPVLDLLPVIFAYCAPENGWAELIIHWSLTFDWQVELLPRWKHAVVHGEMQRICAYAKYKEDAVHYAELVWHNGASAFSHTYAVLRHALLYSGPPQLIEYLFCVMEHYQRRFPKCVKTLEITEGNGRILTSAGAKGVLERLLLLIELKNEYVLMRVPEELLITIVQNRINDYETTDSHFTIVAFIIRVAMQRELPKLTIELQHPKLDRLVSGIMSSQIETANEPKPASYASMMEPLRRWKLLDGRAILWVIQKAIRSMSLQYLKDAFLGQTVKILDVDDCRKVFEPMFQCFLDGKIDYVRCLHANCVAGEEKNFWELARQLDFADNWRLRDLLHRAVSRPLAEIKMLMSLFNHTGVNEFKLLIECSKWHVYNHCGMATIYAEVANYLGFYAVF